ncbi:MAG: DUF5717 family protein [Faecalimonas sp.]|nr:DUF5717 family protein [Faecalimonas sp.]
MKNKIKQFAKGDFRLSRPDIVFPQTNLVISVGEGEIYEGSFTIENRAEGNIRGLVYPSSFRVHCLEQGFEGNPVQVKFTYDSTGLLPGQIEQGKFTVVCNGGEYELRFTAIVEKPFLLSEYGKIQNIGDFKRLAQQDFSEAQRIFRTRQFYDILKYEDCRVRNLYEQMRTWSLDEQALEEFLVGTKQKEKIFLSMEQDSAAYRELMEDQKAQIELTKNTWGYMPIQIEADAAFLSVAQTNCSTDDFVGNSFVLEYVIQKDRLHSGHNYGRLCIKTPYETLTYTVCVSQQAKHKDTFGMQGVLAAQGLKEYLLCISGRVDTAEWTMHALDTVTRLQELEPEHEYYQLLKAHVCLRGGRTEEARWILESGNFGKFVIGRKAEISAYHLFLQALLQKDSVSHLRALDEVNRLYIKHPYSWPLLCMLIYLDPKYKDYGDRIRVLERQFFNGSNQVLLYAEAYLCFQEKVLLLRKLESFEIQVLNFATKYRILTEELALHAADLIGYQKKYNKKLVRILERSYEMYAHRDILQALCTQLIKGNKFGTAYFKWYALAVEQGLKIAQLYEYYMMSMPLQRTKGPFPKLVYLYFSHGMQLDERRTALLYENILTYEDEESEVFASYREQMYAFAKNQLLKRKINDSLRVLYNRFFHENNLGFEEVEALYDICHKYHVTTSSKNMKYLLVIEKDGNIRQRVAYGEHGANIYLYDKESRIVWEGNDGRHYTDSVPYDTVRLFYEMRFMELCKKHITVQNTSKKEEKPHELNFENLRLYGIDAFEEEEVFLLCTKRIREQEQVEDDFLLYICFDLFMRGMYDKALLHYLAHFYCGATGDMKLLWRKAREYGVRTRELAERIITQMLFSEVMSKEAEIFEDYYAGKPYFRLKQAYLAYVSCQYVVKNREMEESIFRIMLQEFAQKEYLADICKAAILKYYAGKQVDAKTEGTLKVYLQELCEQRMVFSFYQRYPKSWLREVQLYDKFLVEYHGEQEARVKIHYRLDDGKMHTETLAPNYENTYVKEFILFSGETLQYSFTEELQGVERNSKKYTYTQEWQTSNVGKYGKLNELLQMHGEEQERAMLAYERETALANHLFPVR